MNRPIHITPDTLPGIIDNIKNACDAKKDYQVEITLHDNSLKGRQRALAQCWYKEIAEQMGVTVGHAEAYCKLAYGLRICSESDPDLKIIISKMLDGRQYAAKLIIIETYSEWFPVLRKEGMNVERQGRYLYEIQRNMGANGIFLASPNERQLLSYPEAA